MHIQYIDFNNKDQIKSVKLYLQKHINSGFFMLPDFLHVVEKTYTIDGYYLICAQEKKIIGIASFYIKPNIIGKNTLISIPHGFWAKNKISEKALITELKNIAKKNKLKGPVFKDLYAPLKTIKKPIVLYSTRVDLNNQDIFKIYPEPLKRQIKKAKNTLIIEKSNNLKAFYKIWSYRMKNLGTPALPFIFFKNLEQVFKNKFVLFLVKKQNQYIGGAILIHYGKIIFNPYIACYKKTFKYYPNQLLYHHILTYAKNNDFYTVDLGRSQLKSGTEKFKLKFGGKLISLYSYGQKTNSRNPIIKYGAFFWKAIPMKIANWLGPKIRKYIPFG